MHYLEKIKGEKGCKKCPKTLTYLALDLEQTARYLFVTGDEKWERVWERAVGVRMSIGLLEEGAREGGQIMAELPEPPNVDRDKWRGGPRFLESGFTGSIQEAPTNPGGKPAKDRYAEPAPKRTRKKKGPRNEASPKGMRVVSKEQLAKERGEK